MLVRDADPVARTKSRCLFIAALLVAAGAAIVLGIVLPFWRPFIVKINDQEYTFDGRVARPGDAIVNRSGISYAAFGTDGVPPHAYEAWLLRVGNLVWRFRWVHPA